MDIFRLLLVGIGFVLMEMKEVWYRDFENSMLYRVDGKRNGLGQRRILSMCENCGWSVSRDFTCSSTFISWTKKTVTIENALGEGGNGGLEKALTLATSVATVFDQ